jgi:phosphoglycerate kinase
LEKEVKVLSDLLKKPDRPFSAIIGGIKLETKIKTILNILKIADFLILGSKIGEVFYAKEGLLQGKNFPEEKLIEGIDFSNPKIYLPKDGVMCSKTLEDKYLRSGMVESLKNEEEIFDIGSESIMVFKEIIKKSKTILWNGSLGMHEDKRFEKGTKEIAKAISKNSSAFKVAGGGETISAINDFGLKEGFSFLSTGGGAMLEFLGGEKLPGIEALK